MGSECRQNKRDPKTGTWPSPFGRFYNKRGHSKGVLEVVASGMENQEVVPRS